MNNSIIYLKSSTLRGSVNLFKLQTEIENSNISKNVMNMVDSGDEFIVVFNQELNQSEIAELDNLVSSHNFLTLEEEVQLTVKLAIDFGQQLILNFAAENVLMGITQAGKTKDVADYLADVTRYAQTGSLYEVINEIDRLQTAGLPVNLEPFITQTRLDNFKQQILDFLT